MKVSRKNLWEALPRSIRAFAGSGIGLLPLDLVLGREFRRARLFLDRAQWWSSVENERYQLGQLRRILVLAERRSPYYRSLFQRTGFDVGRMETLSDLRKLPLSNKATVLENLESMMTCSPNCPGVDYVSTGGTSGLPLAFYSPSSRSAVEFAYLTMGWERTGYRLGDTMAVIRGRVVSRDGNGLEHEHDPLLRHHYYSNFHLNENNGRLYLNHIAKLGPCVLHAYPSSAAALARIALRMPALTMGNINAVLLESENLYPDQKSVIEEAFGLKPFPSYGHSEKLVLAVGCEQSDAYHVWPTYGFCELLNEFGEPVTTPGETGEIVGTGFINTVVPMIRYRTGDFATYGGDRCEFCGRHHTILREIRGRWPQGNLIAVDGSVISMTTLNMHDDCMRRIQEYQFLQDKPGVAQLSVKTGDDWSEEERARVERMANSRLQGQVAISVVRVEKVHRSPQGKVIRVISSNDLARSMN